MITMNNDDEEEEEDEYDDDCWLCSTILNTPNI